MKTLLVSAYTPGYCDLAGRLSASARKFEREIRLEQYYSTGDWVRNGHVKPRMLLEALVDEKRQRPVCWVDADAELVASPKGLDSITGADVAVCRLSEKEVLSGTVWLAPTPGAMWLLAAWEDECRAHPGQWDQSALAAALRKSRAPVKVAELHPSLCFIPGTTALKKGEPVIVHHQASREIRAGTRSM